MYEAHLRGVQPAEIARMAARGELKVPAFEIPRRSVHEIVSRMKRDRYPTGAEAASQTEGERLQALIRRGIARQEALGDKADPQAMAQLARSQRTLNGMGTAKGNGYTKTNGSRAFGPSVREKLERALAKTQAEGKRDKALTEQRILERDQGACQRCGAAASTLAFRATTGPTAYSGVDANLEAVCIDCHQATLPA